MKGLILRYFGFVPCFFTLEKLQKPSLHIKNQNRKKQVNAKRLPASVGPWLKSVLGMCGEDPERQSKLPWLITASAGSRQILKLPERLQLHVY